MHFAIVGNGWSAARFRAIMDARGWSSETLRLPRVPRERADALRAAASSGGANAFVVTTPPFVQVEDATTLAREGARVLVEKPVGLKVAAVRELRAVANSARTTVLAAYHLAANPLVHRMTAPETLSMLGETRHARFRMDVSSARPANTWLHDTVLSGGLLVETLVHGFHLLDLVVGPIQQVVAVEEHRAAATVLLRHVSGATSSIEGAWGGRASTRRGHLELLGSQGAASFYRGDGVAYELRIAADGHELATYREPDEDVGFGVLLEHVGTPGPTTPILAASVGLERAERALALATTARELAQGQRA